MLKKIILLLGINILGLVIYSYQMSKNKMNNCNIVYLPINNNNLDNNYYLPIKDNKEILKPKGKLYKLKGNNEYNDIIPINKNLTRSNNEKQIIL
jgi:hypothetical protein